MIKKVRWLYNNVASIRAAVLIAAALTLGCAAQRAQVGQWWAVSGSANTRATVDLIANQALLIADRTVYSKAQSAEDALAKNFNVQGFGDALRQMESGLPGAAIEQIPDFVMKLRQIWLGPQTHYTNLAANVAVLIQAKYQELHPKTDAERQAIIEAVIKGLQQPAPALVGP